MAEKEIKLRIEAAVEAAEAAKSLGGLKRALLDIQELQVELGDTSGENFDKLGQASTVAAQKLAETRDAIGDIKDRTSTLEGTPVERLSGSFGLLRESIFNLDFDKAKIGVEGLINTFTPVKDGKLVTGFAGIGGAVSNLGGTLKTLGGNVVSLGKQILANPIFLLGAVIALIVVGIVALLKSLGILEPVLDAIKKAIGFVVDAFKAFTDLLGLTDNAAEDFAVQAKKRSEDSIKNIENEAKAKEDIFNLTKNLSDEEIKLLEERLGIEIDTSQSIFDIRAEAALAKQDEIQFEMDAINAKRTITEEDKKRLEELSAKYQEESGKIQAAEREKQAAIINGSRSADKILEGLRAKAIESESGRSKAFLDIAEQEAVAKINQAIREAQQLGDDDTVKKLEEARTLTQKDFQKQREKITSDANKAAATAAASAAKTAEDNYKGAIGKELKALQEAEAAKIKSTAEGSGERLAAELASINKVEAFQKANAKALGISQNGLTIITQDNIDKRLKLQEGFDNKVLEADNKKALAAAELAVSQAVGDQAKIEAQIKLIETQRDIEIQSLEEGSDERVKIETDTNASIEEKRKELTDFINSENQKVLDGEKLVAETRLSQAQFDADRTKGDVEKETAELLNLNTLKIEQLDAQRLAELANTELTKQEIAAIEENYRQSKLVAEEDLAEKLKGLKEQDRQSTLSNVSKGLETTKLALDAIGSLTSITQRNKLKGVKKGSEEEAVILEKQFEQQKKMQLAMAVINGAQAILAILSVPDFTLGVASAIRIGASILATAASIATISSTSFEAPGTPPDITTPDVSGTEGGAAGGGFSPTQFFGLGQGQGQNGGAGGGMTQVFVTEGDITSTQNKVRVIENRAVIG